MMPISIIAAGMVTAVGFNYPTSSAAIRAGIKGFRQVNLWDATAGEYLMGAKVDLPQWWEGVGKLAELVAPAIWECLEEAKPTAPQSIPILLGIAPPDRPYRIPRLDEEILDDVEWRLQLPHHPLSAIFPTGNVSGLDALFEARRIIAAGLASFCVVAGVDSFLQQNVARAYMDQSRIMTKSNSNGFFPGEAGCAVLIGPIGSGKNGELRVLGMGFGSEAATVASDLPLRATGQVESIRGALEESGIPIVRIGYRNTDVNGEHYKFKEAMLSQGRLLRPKLEDGRSGLTLWHAAECVGEIGAAHVPCALAMSLCAGQKEFAPGTRCLLHFSGDGSQRAACVTEFLPRSWS